jgi:site-specific DNA-adenine methylase
MRSAKPFTTYPGSKDAAGSAQRIIRTFPPHSIYVELFLGGGAVLRRKTPALRSIGLDRDPRVVRRWRAVQWPGLEVFCCDAIEWLEQWGPALPGDALVYADPPYPLGTRSKRRLYRYELSDEDHARLLAALDALPCSVVVSSYANPLYARKLAGWDHDQWRAATRGGARTEHVWFRRSTIARFGEDTRCVGQNFRERERLKRKASRWVAKVRAMPPRERAAILAAVIAAYGEEDRTAGNDDARSAGGRPHRRG